MYKILQFMSNYTINIGGKEVEASTYQSEIFENIEKGSGNLIINAAAGAAKTTTIVNAIRFIPDKKKILFVAFNKDIVKTIKEKVHHENTLISTFHSLGYRILNEHWRYAYARGKANDQASLVTVNEYKYINYIKNNINKLTSSCNTTGILRKKREKKIYINNIIRLVDYSRYYLAFTERQISDVAVFYGIEPIADEFKVVNQVLSWGKENLETIDYTDMIWLPNVLNLGTKANRFDWIFIDEAQDTSIAEQALIEKCFKRGTRFAVVCDTYQQINVWCGSTMQAIDNFKKFPKTKEYKLPVTYRCPKKVVELAQEYSNNIIAPDTAIDGEVNYDVEYDKPNTNDMVLCRKTAPLVNLLTKYLRLGKKSYMRGADDIKDNYLSLIQMCESKLIDRNLITSDGLFPCIYNYFFDEIDRIHQMYGTDEDDTLMHPYISELYDTIEGLKVLSEGILGTEELIARINTIFDSSKNEGIELSTVHKAKGLEANNVFILLPSLMPSPLAQKEWEINNERNLIYVAYTRAKRTLNFIKEDIHTNSCNTSFDLDKFKKELDNIREKLKSNKKFGIFEENFQTKENNFKTLTLGDNWCDVVNNKPNSSKKAGNKLKGIL